MASHLPIYRNYARRCQWRVFNDVLDYTYCIEWMCRAAKSVDVNPLYGTVCRLLGAAAVHH